MATLRTSAAGGSSSGTGNRTVTIVPAIGDLLVIYCCVAANTNNTPTCSDDNGGTYDRIDIANFAISTVNYRLSVFIRTALVPNTTSTIVTVATGSNSSGAVHCLAISGMTKTGAAAVRSRGLQDNQAAGTPEPILDQAALTGNITIVALGSADTTTTEPTGWTEAQDTNFINDTIALETAVRASGFTGTNIPFGAACGTQFASHAMELDITAASVSPSASLSPSASISPSASESPSLSLSVSPSASESPSLSPSASVSPSSSESPSVSPSASLSPSGSESPSVSPSASLSPSASESPSSSESPSVSPSASISPSASASPSLSPSASVSPSPPPLPELIFADPGGDAVQTDGYFGVAQGTGTVSFDTSQKRNGVGSWKFDSGGGSGNPHRKVAGILPTGGRIGGYFRYDSVPNTNSQFTSAGAESVTAYSGGGFVDGFGLEGITPDDEVHATATPAKNGAQGSTLTGFFGTFAFEDQGYIVDSIKIIYERLYNPDPAPGPLGTSRVRWKVGEEEGPNHDNTDMPTTPTVVEVDITSERTWTPADINSMEVIVEALRGDTDTPHTQSWDYVVIRIDYHASIPILWGQTAGGIPVLRLEVLPSGSGIVFRLGDSDGDTVFYFDGISILLPDQFHRVGISYVINAINDMDVKLFVNGVEELSLDGRPTFNQTSAPDLLYGWVGSPGASQVCWFDQVYIDDVDDLTDPGPIYMTAKLPAAVNADNFDTTGGTGAVNERPVSLTNYRQQAGVTQVHQNYTLQAASVGDIDISGETLIGHMGWAIAKKGSGSGTGAGLTVNGVTTDVTLATSAALVKKGVFSEDYPSDAAGIGLRSVDGDADTFLYECGAVVAYQGPLEDILFAEYLLLVNQSAEVVDDLRAAPPSTYLLRYWIREGGGTVLIRVYSITAEGESPQLRTTFGSSGGAGTEHIGTPGIEVRIVMEVSDADTFVMLQHYLS